MAVELQYTSLQNLKNNENLLEMEYNCLEIL